MRNKTEKITIVFYADEGFIGGSNHTIVQRTLNKFVKNFKSFGLLMNVQKTETMTLTGSKPVYQISDDAYN
jgi:hypothetical protein